MPTTKLVSLCLHEFKQKKRLTSKAKKHSYFFKKKKEKKEKYLWIKKANPTSFCVNVHQVQHKYNILS